jgi:hypothetical protein
VGYSPVLLLHPANSGDGRGRSRPSAFPANDREKGTRRLSRNLSNGYFENVRRPTASLYAGWEDAGERSVGHANHVPTAYVTP